MLFKAIQDRPVIVKSYDKTWPTGKRNGNTLILVMRNPWTYEKTKLNDARRRARQVGRCTVCYWGRVEGNYFSMNEVAGPKQE